MVPNRSCTRPYIEEIRNDKSARKHEYTSRFRHESRSALQNLGILRWRTKRNRGFRGEVEEGECLLQIQANVRIGMAQVADGSVLANLKIKVAAARGDHERTVNGGRPDDFSFNESLDMVKHRISIVAGFGELGIRVGAEQNAIRPIDADKPQLAQGLRKGFWVLSHVGGKRFLRIARSLPNTDDASRSVALENGAVFRESKLARGVFCRLPIGIVSPPFDVVNHLSFELERNAHLDKSFHLAQLRCDTVPGRGNRRLVPGPHRCESRTSGAVNVHN